MPAATPTETPRPVTTAVRLLYALAVLPVISTALLASLRATNLATALLALPGVLFSGLLAYYVGQGKNAARIIVWVLAAWQPLTVLANTRALHHSYAAESHPRWGFPYLLTIALIHIGVLATTAILLALPAARPHFQHRIPVETPQPAAPVEDSPEPI
jgi:hypothetical protein